VRQKAVEQWGFTTKDINARKSFVDEAVLTGRSCLLVAFVLLLTNYPGVSIIPLFMKSLLFLCLIGLLAGPLAVSPSASAITLPLDGGWVLVDEEEGTEGYEFGAKISVHSKHRIELCLTDLYVPGEVYEVYANGTKIGTTGEFNAEFSGDWTDDPEEARLLGSFSHGCWVLDPGEYILSLLTLQRPVGEAYRNTWGTVAISARELPQSVPEGGSTTILFASSLLGLAAGGRLLRGRH